MIRKDPAFARRPPGGKYVSGDRLGFQLSIQLRGFGGVVISSYGHGLRASDRIGRSCVVASLTGFLDLDSCCAGSGGLGGASCWYWFRWLSGRGGFFCSLVFWFQRKVFNLQSNVT
jgi:hypothetical protein